MTKQVALIHLKRHYLLMCLLSVMTRTKYSGTCAIRQLSFPASCDIRQQNYDSKVFLLTKIKPEYSYILYNPMYSLVPWCVRVDRFYCIWWYKALENKIKPILFGIILETFCDKIISSSFFVKNIIEINK
jgi:hypothetical protein